MTTYYFWDEIEDNVVREYDENNNTVARYATEPTLYGSVLSQDRRREKRYLQFDGLGNTTELTNASGDVTDTRRYSVFGETMANSGTTSTPYGFGARWGYHTSGDDLISIRRRHLTTRRGRWLTVDPLARFHLWPYSTDFYTFTSNTPTNSYDPSGLFATPSLIDNSSNESCQQNKMRSFEEMEIIFLRDKFCASKCTVGDKPVGGAMAWVSCNGKGGFVITYATAAQLGEQGGLILSVTKGCRTADCTSKHEMDHIAQFAKLCPGACKDKAAGGSVGFSVEACTKKMECLSLYKHFLCLYNAKKEYAKGDKVVQGQSCKNRVNEEITGRKDRMTAIACASFSIATPPE